MLAVALLGAWGRLFPIAPVVGAGWGVFSLVVAMKGYVGIIQAVRAAAWPPTSAATLVLQEAPIAAAPRH